MKREVSKMVDIVQNEFKQNNKKLTESLAALERNQKHLEESLDAKMDHIIKQLAAT